MTGKRARIAIAFGLIAVLAVAAGYWSAGRNRQPAVERIPLALSDLDGTKRTRADWPGRYLLLNFWATWCAPCREEIPLLNAAQRRYGDHGLQIIGIAFDKPAAIRRFQQQTPIRYPVLVADDRSFALMGQYGNRTQGLPFSVLLAPDGRVLATRLDAFRGRELERLIGANVVKNQSK